MPRRKRIGKVKVALGWPLRRVLDPRMEATIEAVDFRLGSFGEARPSIHRRLDELEIKLDRLGEQLNGLQHTIRREAALERRATDDALSAILERLRRFEQVRAATGGIDAARAALAGERAWVVGGALRDRALGIAPAATLGDVDVVVAGGVRAAAQRLARAASTTAFEHPEVVGAWRVTSPGGGWQIELAPLVAATIVEDLRQRDFTVNAIAQPLEGGEPIDPTGGLVDAAARRLRMISDEVFAIDPLRALRLARLACELELEPERATSAAAAAHARLLAEVAPERVFAELRRILAARRPLHGLQLMDELGLTAMVLPEAVGDPRGPGRLRALLALESDLGPVGEHAEAVRMLLETDVGDELTRGQAMRLAALLAGDATGEMARTAMHRLRVGERLRTHVAAVARGTMRAAALATEDSIEPRGLHAYLREAEPVQVDAVVLAIATSDTTYRSDQQRAGAYARLAAGRALLAAALDWQAAGPPAPLLGGYELAAELDIEPGPALGWLLAELEAAQYAGEISTAEQALGHARRANDAMTAAHADHFSEPGSGRRLTGALGSD